MTDLTPRAPQVPPEETRPRGEPRIGTDEWVASVEERIQRRGGVAAPLVEAWERVPVTAQFAAVVALAAVFPLLTANEYYQRIGVNTLLFALLALGLNVVVGWAGLLDLGYVAFYGFGAYVYAFLSSGQFDLHLPTPAAIAAVVAASALLGLLLGLPSRRLVGDYLAIVTLFFAQIFLVLANNAQDVNLPWRDAPIDITGGPNGITDLDPFRLFGWEATTPRAYYYVALATFAIVLVALHYANRSRTGRAWRALREDPLAAEAMGMPVNRLKLLAFAFGAASAGLTGSIFAAVQTGVFPQNFELPLLITIYAMVILGGAGSIVGVVLGATAITVVTEVLEQDPPKESRWLFYLAVAVAVLWLVRPLWRGALALAATVALGFLVRAVGGAAWDGATGGAIKGDDRFAHVVDDWVLLPSDAGVAGNVAFVVLVAAVIALVQLRGWPRIAALVPTLYLAVFVWENQLAFEPGITRLLLLGALLVVLMNVRPQGLLGTSRVEIV